MTVTTKQPQQQQHLAPLKQAILKQVRKQYGLTVHPDASQFLAETLASRNATSPAEIKQEVGFIFDIVLRENDDLDIVTLEAVQAVVNSLTTVQRENARTGNSITVSAHEALKIVDMFNIPKYSYSVTKFIPSSTSKSSSGVFCKASDKSQLFRDRYDLLQQQLKRSERYKEFKITPIKNLAGCFGEMFYIFGMLSRLQDGMVSLEDADADIRLDLSNCLVSPGIFTEGCFVLVHGEFVDEYLFRAEQMAMPEAEERAESLLSHPMVDFFGASNSVIDAANMQRLEEDPNQMIIILSDVWLDQARVMEKLRALFDGYSSSGIVPVAFVLMGDFFAEAVTTEGLPAQRYREAFRDFAALVGEFPELATYSHFIMIPGPSDPWCNNMLPRPGIPHSLGGEAMNAKIKNWTFASNPCRIRYCTQDIVIFRQNMLSRLHRNAIVKANLDSEPLMHKHMVKTLIGQMYLSPLPIQVSPVFWTHSHALNLYPLPDLLIMSDRMDPFEMEDSGCLIANPGAFAVTNFQFHVYFPASKTCEISQVPE